MPPRTEPNAALVGAKTSKSAVGDERVSVRPAAFTAERRIDRFGFDAARAAIVGGANFSRLDGVAPGISPPWCKVAPLKSSLI
jgi:hypothetical protein